MTLVEVVAASLLVGTLVTGSLTARARYITAIKTSEWQMAATEIARNLITDWRLEETNLTGEASGTADWRPEWSWSRRSQVQEVADGLSATMVTLELRRYNAGAPEDPWRREFSFVAREKDKERS